MQQEVLDTGASLLKYYDTQNTRPYSVLEIARDVENHITGATATLDVNVAAIGGSIGQVFGSAIGRALAPDNQFAQLAAGTVAGAIGQRLAQTISSSLQANGSAIAVGDIFADFDISLASAAAGSVASFLTAEIGTALGLDGFGAQLFNAGVGGFAGSVAQQVALQGMGKIATINWSSAFTAAEVNIGGAIGSILANQIVHAQTQAGAIGGQIAGAIGSAIGAAIVADGLGFVLNIAIPGIGSLIGTILGTLIGDAIGDEPQYSYAFSTIEPGTDSFSGQPASAGGGGDGNVAQLMATAASGLINAYLSAVDGVTIAYSKQLYIGYSVSSYGPGYQWGKIREMGESDQPEPDEMHGYLSPDHAVNEAAVDLLQHTEVIGGNLLLKRAHHHSQYPNTMTFAGDLQVAQDYERYLNNREAINALIAANPNTAFTAGWAATFARINDLSLSQYGAVDFLGGLVGYLDSVNKAGLHADASNLSVRQGSNGSIVVEIRVPNGTDIPGSLAVFANQTTETHDATGTTLQLTFTDGLAAGGFHLLAPGQTTGDTGNDVWFGNANAANTFNAVAGSGNDILVGGALNDVIHAGSGWDFIDGGAGTDQLFGDAGNDALRGGAGDDTLAGGDGDDQLAGGAGADLLQGGVGDDDYRFCRGDGADAVQDLGGGADVLTFGPGITAADLWLQVSGNNLIVAIRDPAHPNATFAELTDRITLYGGMTEANRVETFQFADGSSRNVASIVSHPATAGPDTITWTASVATLYGEAGNDVLTGGTFNDTLSGDDGNDTLNGAAGNDTYVFNRGGDVDTMLDVYRYMRPWQEGDPHQGENRPPQEVHANAGSDTLAFGPGISLLDIEVQLSGNNLIVGVRDPANPNATFAQLTDRITLLNWTDPLDRIETFSFADGMTLDLSAGRNAFMTGLSFAGGPVAENAATGTAVGTAAGHDLQADAVLTYSLTNSANGRFAINATTGAITVANGALLNFETATSHTITARVTDQYGIFADRNITVAISNVNEAPTNATMSGDSVAEMATNGTVVGRVTGVDLDPGSVLTYALTDNAGGRFAINATTGDVTVANGSLLDYEATVSHAYAITVRVTDQGGLSVDRNFNLGVSNVNDAPVVAAPSANVAARVGQALQLSSLFSATDADNNTLTYYLYNNTIASSGGHFMLNGTALPNDTMHALTAAQFAQATFVPGPAGTADHLSFRVFDGQLYSNWSELNINVNSTVIEAYGSTRLMQFQNQFDLIDNSSGLGPSLKFAGTAIVSGQFGIWTPISAERTVSGYDVVLKFGTNDQYMVWSVDATGDYLSNTAPVAGSDTQLTSLESRFGHDLNGDGIVTGSIETRGSTKLTQFQNQFNLVDNNSGSGTTLKFLGVPVVSGQFGIWTPMSAERTASGYDVVLKFGTDDQYMVWSVDATGNYISNTAPVAGSNPQLTALESAFRHDLNGDGVINGSSVTEAIGSTRLIRFDNQFDLVDNNSGSGPSLKYSGTAVVSGQFGDWTPIGAERTASGYNVVLKLGSTDQYTIWSTDSNGNYISNAMGAVSGASTTLQSFETALHQDLNGDGVITASVVIETYGSTHLMQLGNQFELFDSGRSGPSLKYLGTAIVSGQFGIWTPIGAERTASGYNVVLKFGSEDQYLVWTTDSTGNYISNTVPVAGSDLQLRSLESWFHQDLNGDGVTHGAPVILDLDGDGVEITQLSSSSAFFDMDGEAGRERTAWVGGNDGLLAIDLGASGNTGPDGVIDQTSEIVFTNWAPGAASDMAALRQVFDTNHNGQLDSSDDRWSEFRIWQDANGDGVSDTGEVRTLDAIGIVSIGLEPSGPSQVYSDGSAVNGLANFTWANGTTGVAGDVSFAYQPSSGAEQGTAECSFRFAETATDSKVSPENIGLNGSHPFLGENRVAMAFPDPAQPDVAIWYAENSALSFLIRAQIGDPLQEWHIV